jgi:TPR repeat protein
MRTFEAVVSLGLFGLALGVPPAASFDGTPEAPAMVVPPPNPAMRDLGRGVPLASPATRDLGRLTPPVPVPVAPLTARPNPVPSQGPRSGSQALRSGTQALRDGKPDEAVTALEYAAGQGVPGAMWKLGRMYADGDGVDKNKMRAFEYFRDLAKAHAYDPPGTPQARFVANAFVTLGHFYLEGIPNSAITADPSVAHEMFRYAASYFADPDAQYNLGRLYLYGRGAPKDAIQAARWFSLAADKGQCSAQALLGTTLFKGQDVPRQAALGLAWLTVAKDCVAKERAALDEAWITETYSSAFAQASDNERALAYRYLEDLLRGRRR